MNQLTVLDVSGNASLQSLSASYNYLTVLDVSSNAALQRLDALLNQLTVLDVSGNPALQFLNVYTNKLTVLDVRSNAALQYLDASYNQLTVLDVSCNPALQTLNASNNHLTVLDVSGNPALQRLVVYDNQLTVLDVSGNPALQILNASNNHLTVLDVSGNPALQTLSVLNNELTALDVSGNAALQILHVYDNELTALDVSRNTELSDLDVAGNRIPLSLLYDIVNSGVATIHVGAQTDVTLEEIPSVPVPGAGYDLASEAVLGGQPTDFTFTMDGNTATQSSEYEMTAEGLLTFLERGKFQIVMRNPAVHSLGMGPYLAVVTTSIIDVLPVGAPLRWNGDATSSWLPSSPVGAGKDWLHDGFSVRYLENLPDADSVVFGQVGNRSVDVLAGVHPEEMTVEAGGYVFSGDPIDGGHFALSAPAGSVTRFSNLVTFSSGATIGHGNRLILDYGLSSSSFPNLEVVGGPSPATIDPGSGNVADFDGVSLTWIVPVAARAGDVLLTVDGEARMTPATELRAIIPASLTVRPDIALGESIVLLDADAITGSGLSPVKVVSPDGHVYTLGPDPGGAERLLATLTSLAPWTPSYERMKAYPEAAAASLAFVAMGHDLVVAEGVPSAVAATASPGLSWGAFASMEAGRSRYETGSRVDVSGARVMAGAALGAGLGTGRLTMGVFAEAGKGDYDTANSFASSAKVDGGGKAGDIGGGILVRWEAEGGPLPGLWLETSARAGRQETDFSTGDILYNGARASFRISGDYWGLHGGVGNEWRPGGPDGAFTLDLGARVFWTRQKGSEATVNLDRLRFEDADSLRVRIGGRLSLGAGSLASPYIGAYFEREFDGAARAYVNDVPLETPTLKGNTGIFELGARLEPSPDGPLSIEFGALGYAGRRDGVSGTLTVRLKF
jgi:outer membrane autotransporter protein